MPAARPSARNTPAISSKPHPNLMMPNTKIANAAAVVASTSPCLRVMRLAGTPAGPSTAVRVRRACRIVAHAQNATAGTSTASRNGQPERMGSSANRCAMPTPNGFMGLNVEPMPAAPRLIDTAVSAVEAHAARQHQQHRHQRDDLLPHALRRACRARTRRTRSE